MSKSGLESRSESAREWVWIGLFTVLGAVPRLGGQGSLGLDHFDEGIYALAGTWSLTGGLNSLDPQLIPFAPAGYPLLIGLANLLFGPSAHSGILVSIVTGLLTIPLIGWMGRRWLGPGAGAAAAAILAVSGRNIAFDRSGLTDATALLTWLLALAASGEWLARPTFLGAVRLGIAVALAQWFKYSGWLAGAQTALAAMLLVGQGFRQASSTPLRSLHHRLAGLGVAATTAALLYAPWYLFVERHGGYLGLLKHHRSYVNPISQWFRDWQVQVQQVNVLSFGQEWELAGWALGLLAAWDCRRRGRGGTGPESTSELLGDLGPVARAVLILAFALGIAILGWPNATLIAGFLGIIVIVATCRPRSAMVILLATWWTVSMLLTPLYHPYARLWLPLEAAGTLFAAAWLLAIARVIVSVVLPAAGRSASSRLLWRRSIWILALTTAVISPLLGAPWVGGRPRLKPSDRADGLPAAVSKLRDQIPRDRVVLMFARPSLSYNWAEFGLSARRVGSLGELDRAAVADTWLLVDEAAVGDQHQEREALASLRQRTSLLVAVPAPLKWITALDVDPGRVVEQGAPALANQLLLLRPRGISTQDEKDPR